ncbi:hypothetical protein CC86DRAFT_411377 [Ophiobolus disseminans]|uniref:Uncharacterized protein n=1 Tax=Ophiobolus disseminans TaxID=1469910 RepID=A0A6A6ZLE8_9PLEO|nr:hypothetical protein CC86DRAFT_411377 [Ophiobolus disseminans]
MASKFQFKFLPESLPKLTSSGNNYPEWRSAWQIAFCYMELWPLISGKTNAKRHKGNLADANSDWDSDNNVTEVHAFSAAAPTTINLMDNGSGNWLPDYLRTSFN